MANDAPAVFSLSDLFGRFVSGLRYVLAFRLSCILCVVRELGCLLAAALFQNAEL